MKLLLVFLLLIATTSFRSLDEKPIIPSNSINTKINLVSFAGTWDTTFGRMKIYQNGYNVYGNYSWYDGSFEGYVNSEGVMIITWEQDGGFTCAKGKAVFEMNSSGNRFYGTWGCGGRSSGGGDWKGEKY